MADKPSSATEIQKSHNITPREERRGLHRAVDCHKHITNKESSLSFMFVKKNRARAICTGEINKMGVSDIRSNMGCNASSYRGPSYCNSLPSDARSMTDSTEFKTVMTMHITGDDADLR